MDFFSLLKMFLFLSRRILQFFFRTDPVDTEYLPWITMTWKIQNLHRHFMRAFGESEDILADPNQPKVKDRLSGF